MNRLDIVQAAVGQRNARSYLEIGVKKGKVFLKVRARMKLAVDPVLKISPKRKVRSWFMYPFNIYNEYYKMTSDDFFKLHHNRLSQLGGLDVVFIDGLHTHEQTWKDVHNSLEYLHPNGFILMHDCNPASAAQATPATSLVGAAATNNAPRPVNWSGDVWKTIVRLLAEREDLQVSVLDCDHGVGIILRGKPDDQLSVSEQEIGKMGYEDLQKDRKRLLNLSNHRKLQTILRG